MITVVTTCYTNFKKQFTSTSPVFTRQIIKNKKKLGKCVLNKLLNLNRGAPCPQVVDAILKLVIFMTKQRSQKKKSLSKLLLTAKYIAESDVPCFPLTWIKLITIFIQKVLGFKREL